MLLTLIVAIMIATAANRAARRVADSEARFIRSERRQAIRDILRESTVPEDVRTAFEDARSLFFDDAREMKLVKRLYYTNTSIPLDEFARSSDKTPPSAELLESVRDSLESRLSAQAPSLAIRSLTAYGHMDARNSDGDTVASHAWSSPAYAATKYVLGRLNGLPYERESISAARSFIIGPDPQVARMALGILSDPYWEPLEVKFTLSKFCLLALGWEGGSDRPLRRPAIDCSSEVARFFQKLPALELDALSNIEINELESFADFATEFVIGSFLSEPESYQEALKSAVPVLSYWQRTLRGSPRGTASEMMWRIGQFSDLYDRWQSKVGRLDAKTVVLQVSDLLEFLFPPARRQLQAEMNKAVMEGFGGRPVAEEEV